MPASISVYTSERAGPRLLYVLKWIFTEQLGTPFRVFHDKAGWMAEEGPKINYSGEDLPDALLRILPSGLLSEQGRIAPGALSIQRWKKTTVLFYNQPAATIPFDLFSAVFYLISRYEEYLPHQTDKHGRYMAQQSAAGQFGFLQEPVVDLWIHFFREILEHKSGVSFPPKPFRLQMTFDIDLAWKYLHKGKGRYWGGQLKDFFSGNWTNIKNRRDVLAGKKEDPYFSFPQLDAIHDQYGIQPVYFVLLGTMSRYDRNADPTSRAMQHLMLSLSRKYPVGIHPSYGSHQSGRQLEKEINILSDVIGEPVVRSRQHYIKFTLPHTYRRLISCGIREDYSMGYATHNGFRAGTSCSFPWYDLEQESETGLRIYPFAFMDATARFYANQPAESMLMEWKRLYHQIKKVNGTFISIWHNFILSGAEDRESWLPAYRQLLQTCL